ncbi:hypothetical protein [Streptomyces tsukubensis]|uniref:hypothetical protein n=1 Tax=Streptomyces tsukubensis TaxID=83656 RepID=UPI00344E7A4A
MRTGTAAQLAAVLAAGALLGCSGCASPAVDPIERLGRRAVHSGETPAVSPAPGPRASAGAAGPARSGPEPGAVRSRAPLRTPASGTPAAPASRTPAPAFRTPAPAFHTPAPASRAPAPAFRVPALAEPAGRLLDRLHGTHRPAPRPGDALRAPRER